LIHKRIKRFKNIDEIKAKKRVSDFLLRRGFSWEIISQVLERWNEIGVRDN
ncbi:MAG: RecX family transcriptional regulator, partial [bacterium]